MIKYQITFTIVLLILTGCSSADSVTSPDLDSGSLNPKSADDVPGYIPWGFYDFEIARDGSSATVIPNRSVSGMWGYHMNVVKLLEVNPCTDCLNISNIHLLPNGDVSVDISIRHPYWDRRYTGFDVRGIIMFPATQYYPDNTIRELIGIGPYPYWKLRIANHDYGDAELMNADGWTVAWSAEEGTGSYSYGWDDKYAPEDLPIFRYYPGRFSAGEDLSTLSAFKRFHSTDVRHMFEVGQTVTQTYIIRPPETGPIVASYAVYAHWFPADNFPVIDPAADFPPEANSPLPYEYYITQDAPIDPDAPNYIHRECIRWHIKMWSIEPDMWRIGVNDLASTMSSGSGHYPHPDGNPDEYLVLADYIGGFADIPDALPGTWSWLFAMKILNPKDTIPGGTIAMDTYIADLEYDAYDGQW